MTLDESALNPLAAHVIHPSVMQPVTAVTHFKPVPDLTARRKGFYQLSDMLLCIRVRLALRSRAVACNCKGYDEAGKKYLKASDRAGRSHGILLPLRFGLDLAPWLFPLVPNLFAIDIPPSARSIKSLRRPTVNENSGLNSLTSFPSLRRARRDACSSMDDGCKPECNHQ